MTKFIVHLNDESGRVESHYKTLKTREDAIKTLSKDFKTTIVNIEKRIEIGWIEIEEIKSINLYRVSYEYDVFSSIEKNVLADNKEEAKNYVLNHYKRDKPRIIDVQEILNDVEFPVSIEWLERQ